MYFFEISSKFDFVDGESVIKMKRIVYVGVRKSVELFGIFFVNFFYRFVGSEEFRVGFDIFGKRRGIGFKDVLFGLRCLSSFFEIDKVIFFVGLL